MFLEIVLSKGELCNEHDYQVKVFIHNERIINYKYL